VGQTSHLSYVESVNRKTAVQVGVGNKTEKYLKKEPAQKVPVQTPVTPKKKKKLFLGTFCNFCSL
jgi:hypothetical protein